LPFIGPVWTTTSGRLRRCRVVRPSAFADGAGQRGGRHLAELQVLRAEGVRQPSRQPETHPADATVLAVDDDPGHAAAAQQRRRPHGPGQGVRPGGGAAVGDDDEQRASVRVLEGLDPKHFGGCEQPLRQWRPAAGL
jgi:hypothetical protein